MSRELLIKILSEWVINQTGRIEELTSQEGVYSVQDFMAVTDALFKLKGIEGEMVTLKERGE